MSQVKALFEKLTAERAEIEAKVKPLRDKRTAIVGKLQPLEDQARELQIQIREIQGDRAFELDQEISKLARAMGARTLVAES